MPAEAAHKPVHLVERVFENLGTFDAGSREVERVPIASDDLAKRVLRLETRSATFAIRLHAGRLHDGDILFADARTVVCVEVVPEDVLVLRPSSIGEALIVAHALGNRHLPAQFGETELIVRPDPAVDAVVAEFGITASIERRRLSAPFRHAHAPHGHA